MQVGMFNVTFEPACRNNWHGAVPDSWFSHLAIIAKKAGNEYNKTQRKSNKYHQIQQRPGGRQTERKNRICSKIT